MNKATVAILALLTYSATPQAADGPEPPKTEHDRISYSIGYQIATDLKNNGIAINPSQVLRAIDDVVAAAPPALREEEMRTTLIEFRRQMVAAQNQQRQQLLAKRRDDGRAFMAANGKKDGVVTTASGLQYRVLQEGSGPIPAAGDEVTVHYRGTTIDGKEFDSSARHGKPARLKLEQVIRGWQEGLQQTKAGGKVKLFVPPELGYGERGPLAEQTLIFDVELLAVNDSKK